MDTNFNRIMEFEEVLEVTEAYIKVKSKKTGKERFLRLIDLDKSDVRSKNQIKAFIEKMKLEEDYKKNNRKGFVQIKRSIKEISGKLTQARMHYFVKLLPLISFQDIPLSLKGKPLSQTEIANYIGASRKLTKALLDSLIEVEILVPVRLGKDNAFGYKMHGKYVIKGEFDEHEEYCVKIFQRNLSKFIKKIDEIVEKKNNDKRRKKKLELYPLSLVAGLLPFVHPQAYILCKNYHDDITKGYKDALTALEHNPKLIKKLTKKELWKAITGQTPKRMDGNQREKLEMYFKILKQANVLGSFEAENQIYFINPSLVFVTTQVQNDEWYRSVRTLFGLAKEEDNKNQKEKE
ncbi:hypothetical protein PUS82_05355 [Cytobacillus firmus]|uniref:hypothetical protein n=1 Tax=Cytobacillus firmus TaxID=1399 RepID=UPI00237A89E9|nr:hypothetical protein [Cytobacillus firmus]MDD9310730.1 hypothetical protein [Cytobacillus firmus]